MCLKRAMVDPDGYIQCSDTGQEDAIVAKGYHRTLPQKHYNRNYDRQANRFDKRLQIKLNPVGLEENICTSVRREKINFRRRLIQTEYHLHMSGGIRATKNEPYPKKQLTSTRLNRTRC